MEILVDTREPAAIKKYAQSLGFKPYALPAGDFALRDEKLNFLALVERKNIADFAHSISTYNVRSRIPRIFDQVERMKMYSKINYLLIVGTVTTLKMKLSQLKLQVNEEVLYGGAASIVVRSGVDLLWVTDVFSGIKLVKKVLIKISEGKYMKPIRQKPKGMNKNVDVLAEIPGVSKTVARNLILKFGSISNICNASVSELQTVQGIGSIKAKMIYDFLH